MGRLLRIATYNLENLGGEADRDAGLDVRIAALRPRLSRLDADILCLQEINARHHRGGDRGLVALERLLEHTPYADFYRAMTLNAAGTGPRDIHNLVILSRFPIIAQRQIRHDLVAAPDYRSVTAEPPATTPQAIEWDRPILHATLDVMGRALEVINLHLRAPRSAYLPGQKQSPGVWNNIAGWAEGFFLADIKRSGQALEARLVIERLFDEAADALIVVCGDFNAELSSVPLAILCAEVANTGNPALADRVLFAVETRVPKATRYSVIHLARRLLLDHILVSRPLVARLKRAEVHNEDLRDEATGGAEPASFHAPVLAVFEIDD